VDHRLREAERQWRSHGTREAQDTYLGEHVRSHGHYPLIVRGHGDLWSLLIAFAINVKLRTLGPEWSQSPQRAHAVADVMLSHYRTMGSGWTRRWLREKRGLSS